MIRSTLHILSRIQTAEVLSLRTSSTTTPSNQSLSVPPLSFTANRPQSLSSRGFLTTLLLLIFILIGLLSIIFYVLYQELQKQCAKKKRILDEEMAEVEAARSLRPVDTSLIIPPQFKTVQWAPELSPSIPITPSKTSSLAPGIVPHTIFHPQIQRSRSLADPKPERVQLVRHPLSYSGTPRRHSSQLRFSVGPYFRSDPKPLVPFTITQTRKFLPMTITTRQYPKISATLQDITLPLSPKSFYPRATMSSRVPTPAEPPGPISRGNTTSRKASQDVKSIWSSSAASSSARTSITSMIAPITPKTPNFQFLHPQPLSHIYEPSSLIFAPNSNPFSPQYCTSKLPQATHLRPASPSLYSYNEGQNKQRLDSLTLPTYYPSPLS